MSDILYSEKLRASSGWMSTLLVIIGFLLSALGIYCTLCVDPSSDLYLDKYGLIVIAVLVAFLLYIAFVKKILLEVASDGVHVHYFKHFYYKKEEIKDCEIWDHPTMLKVWGYGIRFSPSAIGFTVPGKKPVKLITENRMDAVICTSDPEAFIATVKRLLQA